MANNTRVPNLPFDPRLSLNPPIVPDDAKSMQTIVNMFHNSIQQILQALNTNAGLGPQNTDIIPQVTGSASTIVAGNGGRYYATATENIAYGQAINLVSGASVAEVQLANATDNTKPCDGFCTAPDGIVSGSSGEVTLATGTIVFTGPLTAGNKYWLAITDGNIVNVAPVAAGNIEQLLGTAIDATHLFFNIGNWIQH